MVKKPPIALNTQERREDAPPAWLETQDSLAETASLALLLVDGYQPPALAISNNNSICQTLQNSPEHVRLCDPYCGAAHTRALEAGGMVKYKCHAGLSCFAKPVEIGGKRKLAVIGGRAFVSSADYQRVMERFYKGDL
jgi:ligand-binding sensor protein